MKKLSNFIAIAIVIILLYVFFQWNWNPGMWSGAARGWCIVFIVIAFIGTHSE